MTEMNNEVNVFDGTNGDMFNDVVGKNYVMLYEGDMGCYIESGVVEIDEDGFANVAFGFKETSDGGYDFKSKEECIEEFEKQIDGTIGGLTDEEDKEYLKEVMDLLKEIKEMDIGKNKVEWFVGGIEYGGGVGFTFE